MKGKFNLVQFCKILLLSSILILNLSLIPALASAQTDLSNNQTSRDRSLRGVPELSVTGAAGAIVLMAGGAFVILGRRKRRND